MDLASSSASPSESQQRSQRTDEELLGAPPSPIDHLRSLNRAGASRLVDTSALEATVRALAETVVRQEEVITGLQEQLNRQAQEAEAAKKHYKQLSATTIEKFSETVGVLQKEITEIKTQWGSQDGAMRKIAADAVEEVAEDMRERWDQQTEWNALRTAEMTYFQDRIGGSASPRGYGGYASPSRGSSRSIAVDGIDTESESLTRRVELLWSMLEMRDTKTVEKAVASGSVAKVRLLHELPAFHLMWAELYRITENLGKVQRNASSSVAPAQLPGVASEATKFGQQAGSAAGLPFGKASFTTPVAARSLGVDHEQHRTSPPRGDFYYATDTPGTNQHRVVSVTQLGIDVVPLAGGRGCMVQRVNRGGPMDLAGSAAGDAIIRVGDFDVSSPMQLLDIVAATLGSSLEGVVVVHAIPHGRANAVPMHVAVRGLASPRK